jgi:hypothetical protein
MTVASSKTMTNKAACPASSSSFMAKLYCIRTPGRKRQTGLCGNRFSAAHKSPLGAQIFGECIPSTQGYEMSTESHRAPDGRLHVSDQ